MMKFLRKNQKKFLAIFTAGLMIAFIADTGYNRYYADDRESGHVVGRIGEAELRANEVQLAENQVRLLLYNTAVQTTNALDPQQQFVSVLEAIRLPEPVIRQWLDKPVTFALLKAEARRIPVMVDTRALEELMGQIHVRMPQPDGRVLPANKAGQLGHNVRASVGDLLLVIEAFSRAANVVKLSRPALLHDAVESNQTIDIRFAEVSARERLGDAPQPTEEQLEEQFRKYADTAPPQRASESNPLRFGYRHPPRVRFQYIAIPREQVKRTVQARKDEYDWQLEAHKYYLQNPGQFTSDGFAAAAAAGAATQPATQPTTRPFAEVREQVLDRVMAPQIDALTQQIRRKIEETMRADHQAWAKAQPATTAPGASTAPAASPATRPVASSIGVPYDSYDYLQKLAEAVQKQYGVLPATGSIGELLDEQQVQDLPGIGPIARQAFYFAEPFVAPAEKEGPDTLSLFEPSAPRADADGSSYLFRITEAIPAHAARSLDEVREQVVEDVRMRWAWEQAKAAAQKLLDDAKATNLQQAAGQRPLTQAGPFGKWSFSEIPGITFDDPASRIHFTTDAYKLVAQAATTQPSEEHKPLGLIELPAEMKVLVAELTGVSTTVQPADIETARLRQPLQLRQEWQLQSMSRWLSYEGVSSRLGFIDASAPPAADDRTAAAAVP